MGAACCSSREESKNGQVPVPDMGPKPSVAVIGGGIGGLTAAIALKKAGADVTVYEQAPQLLEIGAGINVQGVAMAVLVDLGIPLDSFCDYGDGITTSKVEYYTMDGVKIAEEEVGLAAGAPQPQMSVHRAKFHNVLIAECRRVLGEDRVKLDHAFIGMESNGGKVTVKFQRLMSNKEMLDDVECDFVIGADGLKSPVRKVLCGDGLPKYTGRTIYRGLCHVDAVNGDGTTVSLCGDETSNFICYPVSESMRKEGKFHCNWGFNATRPEPGGVESWVNLAKMEDIEKELKDMDGNTFGGLTPLQIAQKTEKIIGWALFDRDPLESFVFGEHEHVTLLGDAAHPLLPFGSQGATQAIMDGEALGVCYAEAMQKGEGVKGVIKRYSDCRAKVSGEVVIANRDMGSTKVLKVANEKTAGMGKEEKTKWCEENGPTLHDEVIKAYRASMPKTVRTGK